MSAGVLTTMRIRQDGGLVTDSATFTLRKNGVDTAITLTVAAAAVSGVGTAFALTIAAGDVLSLKIVQSGTEVRSLWRPVVSVY